MTHRERLLTALNHNEPDRIPIDLASTQVTGISVHAYNRLRDYLGLSPKEPLICDRIQQICIPHDDVLEKFGIDTRGLWPKMNHTEFKDQENGDYWVHTDEWQFGYRIKKQGGLWYDLYKSPMEHAELCDTLIDTFNFPKGDDPERISHLRKTAIEFREADFPVVLKSVCAGLFEMNIRLRGMQNAMMDLLMDPVNSGRLLDRLLQHKLEYWDRALDELGDVVDVLAEGDDFGTQTSQLISIETWRQVIKPRQVELIQFMRNKAPHAKIFFHSCGNVRDYIEEFINMGIDILNPVHITAAGMEPRQLKKDFGDGIVFWGGGIDTQGTMPNGNVSQVMDEVRRNIDVLAVDGGFVFNTIHNIQADVPPENIVAMYETVLECGVY